MRKHVAMKRRALKCLGWVELSYALGFPFNNSKGKSHLFFSPQKNSWGSGYAICILTFCELKQSVSIIEVPAPKM